MYRMMKPNFFTLSIIGCLFGTLSHAHVITGDSTEIDTSDNNAKNLYINNYTGDEVIDVPKAYTQVYVTGHAEIAPFNNTQRSLYVESNSSVTVNGDINVKNLQALDYVINSTIDISGNVTISSMFAIAEPSNTVRIGGTLTINGIYSFIENGSNVYAGGIHISKPLRGISIAGNVYTNSFTTSAATTTFQKGSLLSSLNSATVGKLLINSGSTVDCHGTIELGTELQGGKFSLQEAATISDVTMQSGTFMVLGNAQTGDLTLNAGDIIFSENTHLDLNGGVLHCDSGVNISLTVDNINQLGNKIVLFENVSSASVLPDDFTVTVSDKTDSISLNVTMQGGAIVLNIPEPVTTSLTACGLALLLMRRRRKR